MLNDSGFDPSRDADLVILCEAPSEFAARSLVIVLEDSGIPAHTFGAGELPHVSSLTTGRVRGVAIHVARSDENRARRVLDELPQRASEIDWDAIDVGEMPDEERGDRSAYATSGTPADPTNGRSHGRSRAGGNTASGPPSFLDAIGESRSMTRALLVVVGLGLTLAIVGLLLEVFGTSP